MCVCVCVCVYSCLSYQAQKPHLYYAALYCHVRPVWMNIIIPHYIINSTTFGKKNVMEVKYVFRFSPQLMSETFPTLRGLQRDTAINVRGYSYKVTAIQIRFLMNFPNVCSNNPQILNLIKIRPQGAETFLSACQKKRKT